MNNNIRGLFLGRLVIVAVGGGKGGIGKSFVSSNLGIFLANMGFNTVIVDLDLGAPNLHTALGEPPPNRNFHEYLLGKYSSVAESCCRDKVSKLKIYFWSEWPQRTCDTSIVEQSRLMSALYRLEADFTILDLSAGTHTSTLDFFLICHRHIVTLTPEPTSVENAYRFMKACFYRRIKRFERQLQLKKKLFLKLWLVLMVIKSKCPQTCFAQ